MILFSCSIWFFIGIYEATNGGGHSHTFIEHLIAEIGSLFFFLFVAMTYINALSSLNVFQSIRAKLLARGMGYKQLFWATGGLAFMISPFADNMTSALLMTTVALAVSGGNKKFIVPTFVNIIVAANAGGVESFRGHNHADGMDCRQSRNHEIFLSLSSLFNKLGYPRHYYEFFCAKRKTGMQERDRRFKTGRKDGDSLWSCNYCPGDFLSSVLTLAALFGYDVGHGISYVRFLLYETLGRKKVS